MNAQQLKNSILQMAVQGKLVPQDPNDEPASVLLKRIRAEKEKLIREGRIKKEKNPSYIFRGEDNLPYEKVGKNEPVCIADEVPFEIPDSWEWVRLGNVCTKLVDGDHNPPKGIDMKTPFIMASSTNINNDSLVELEKVRYLPESVFLKENERTNATAGDIFFTSVGSLGRSCIYDGSLNICFQRSVSVMTTLLYNHYLKSFFDSGYFQNKVVKEATGTAQKGFYLNQLATSLIPVPPMEEQKRIVAEIQRFYPYISEYEAKKNELDELTVNFPVLLKKSILQQAVMGKLIPQDSADEPASELLEKIRAEKDALIKAGKLKKDKHESIIYRRDNSHYEKLNGVERCIDDVIPFDIPNSWCWCRLFELCTKITDGSHNPPPKKQAGYRVISAKNIKSGQIVFDESDRFADQNGFDKENPRTNITCNDLIIGIIGGSIGNTAIYMHNDKVIAQRSIAIIKSLISQQYLKLIFDSNYLQSFFKSKTSGTAQGGVYLGELSDILIPLPSYKEQQRIVEKTYELFTLCDELQ